MFEGVVRQVLLGYLGQYIKDIQKEQLKIGLWNEEVLLENVELILEAFDYLQLPFALKQGRVGRLSIKIPWKKLGWEPIIIVLEDVFIRACQRDEHEWNSDIVERREFAGKKAKLAAAELAKLSRRVCNNQTGQSFISYITAKILDGIQLSIRNVHVIYTDQQIDSAQFVFGIRFSSLTVMKQNSLGTFSAKLRGGQVSKMLEISSLGIYCNTSGVPLHLVGIEDVGDARVGSDVYDYIVAPFDVAVSLVVNRSGKLENGAPQYSIGAELTSLVLHLNEIQLKQILILWDYLCTSQLREKYGRYRPSCDSLSRKPKGWQRMWWHYAQESVLSNIRRKLRKTSWKHLGWRISYRRKYVNLYKRKLDFLQQQQPVNEEVLRELELMEKESDIDDILSYRSIAERDLQEILLSSKSPSIGPNGGSTPVEKQQTDERSSGRSRGWLNWLFLGMIGAGETADSSQFSGVVSDEVIKDIYEATEFDPIPSLDGSISIKNRILSSIKFNIHQFTATLGSKNYDREIVQIILGEVAIECKQWDESWTILLLVNSLDIVDPYAKKNILLTRKAFSEQTFLNTEQPSVSVEVDVSPVKSETELSLKVVLQPLEVTYDSEFLLNLLDFHHLLGSLQSQRERVLLSLNGLEAVNSRLLSKAEYILLNRTRIIWDVSFSSVCIKFPLKNDDSQSYFMVLELGTLLLKSRVQMETPALERKHVEDFSFTTFPSSTSTNDTSPVFELQDLYDHFEIVLTDFEVNVTMPDIPQATSIVRKFSASVTLASCIIKDESTLKQLEVHVVAPALTVHFSSSIYGAVVGLIESFDMPPSKQEVVIQGMPKGSNAFQFSITANVELASFHVDLVGDPDSSLLLNCALGELDIQYNHEEVTKACWVCIKTLKIETGTSSCDTSGHTLLLSKNVSSTNSTHQHGMDFGFSNPSDDCGERTASFDGCFVLHYQAERSVGTIYHKLTMGLNEVDLHIYPKVVGLVLQFCDQISQYSSSPSVYSGKNSPDPSKDIKDGALTSVFGLQKFGFSNFYESGSTAASIPMDRFPFITIHNSGSLSSLEQSLIHGIPEWRSTLKVRDTKSVKSPKFNVRKRSRMLSIPTKKYPSNDNASPASGSCNGSDLFFIDFNLSGIRAHFHDSSCILGTLTLPVSKSSIIIQGTDYLDVLCSVEGLLLSSSWSSQYLNKFLWGASESNLAPILNLRLRKQKEAMRPRIEFSLSVQHVCCVLPSEYLAILIGYFSLPDWTSKQNEQCVAEENIKRKEDTDNSHIDIIYKFEVLDSTLILPVEDNEDQSLNLKLQQLYCNFTPKTKSEDALKDIPSECVVQADKVSDRVHILNVFGRGLSLLPVLLKNEGHVPLTLGQGTSCPNLSLISSFDADFWVRIPCQDSPSSGLSTPSTCIMVKVSNSEVIAEDDYFLCGVKAMLKVIDQLSSVGRESESFRSDVLQFLQLKRSIKEGILILPDALSVSLIEAKVCVDSLTIKLYRSRGRHSNLSELVAKADIQLKCSALFRNEIPLCLDVAFSSLSLYSFRSSVVLVRCVRGISLSSGLEIHFSKLNSGENEIVVCLPFLDIWLHLSDWGEVLDLLASYAQKLDRTSVTVEPSKNLNLSTLELPNDVTEQVFEAAPESPRLSSSFVSSNTVQESFNLVLKSEDIGVSLHFPVLVKEPFELWRKPEVLEDVLETEYCKYVTVTLCSRDSVLIINERHAKLKCNVEKTKVMLEIIEDKKVISWPFFQLNQINLVVQICDKQEELYHATAEVRIDSLEVWLTHQIFHFWHDIRLKIPETDSAQSSISIVDFKIHLKKASLLLTDGRWSCNGPLMEIILRNLLFHVNQTGSIMEASVTGDLLVNYNNIQKVMWEPFIEPWGFQLNMIRKYEQSALLNSSVMTDIYLKSTAHLNLNFTEPLIEVIFRGHEMIKDALGQVGTTESRRFWGSQTADNAYTRRYAPYILQNETSLPLLFHVYRGHVNAEDLDILPMKEGNVVQPGSSVPIYIDETPEEQIFRYKPAQSSDRLNEKKSNWVAHHMISIQLDGTSGPSIPISMDLVGLSYFEVDFSKASNVIEAGGNGDASKYGRRIEEKSRTNSNIGFVVPVVFDVSVQRYSKLIRLYSTVVLLNATSMPLELRFDIPFGVSPKVLDPIYPGQEFPLPLHLAEAGRMRWRPLGNSYLWSEAYLLSNILLQENRLGILRSFGCYPSHPSSDPFRCCISIQDISLPSCCGRSSSLHIKESVKHSLADGSQRLHNLDHLKNRAIHYVTLTTPLLVRNHLPRDISLSIESGEVARTVLLSEVDTASIFHTDSTHDLGIVLHMDGFKPSVCKFPRAETFTKVAKFNETKFSFCETLTFFPDSSDGPLYLIVEKVMDAFCGARELSISVPFLLYNCTGLPLTIAECGTEMKGNCCTIPSSYNLFEEDQLLAREGGLSVFSSQQDPCVKSRTVDHLSSSFSKNHTISLRENLDLHSRRFLSRHFNSTDSSTYFSKLSDNHDLKDLNNELCRSSQQKLLEKGNNGSDVVYNDSRKVSACMYSPHSSSSGGELMVKLAACLPECVSESMRSSVWSSPFFLVPTSGSTSVVVPRAFTSGAFIISVTSSQVAGPFSGRTRAITFQPRYVISNACSKDLCFKQKGTDYIFYLGVGQHSHLHWSDTTRDLLVSLRFNEPGWLWSGSFTPDHLGDTQVKMRNYVSGALNMIRAEVQNADVSIRDDKIVGSSHGNSGTNLILLSDDNTGFMPYRIDNFSKERLRIYQQKCEAFETTIHSYTSCGYAWDEPCYPHRLIVEVPGERVLGSYALDDIKEQIPVYLPSTSEKPGKRLFLSSHAEGAVKVLSVIDSSCHLLKDMKETGFPGFKEKKKLDRKQEKFDDYSEKISVHISCIGFSLINSYPQELLFACANDTKIDILQSVDQQKFSFQISSLQIDNQLHNTPYPVILSFDHGNRSNPAGQMKNRDRSSKIKDESAMQVSTSDSSCEPIFFLAAAKWRNKETSLVSFEYISLRLAPLHLELEEEVLLGLFGFVRTVTSRLQSKPLPHLCSTLHPSSYGANFEKERSTPAQDSESYNITKSQFYSVNVSSFLESCSRSPQLPSVVPIGAPWQKIYLLARSRTKIYVEVFDLAPIKLTFSFSSVPWMLRNNGPAQAGFLGHVSSTAFQRGLMALADVEGAPVYLKQLTIVHHMASWESFQEILVRHYSRQLLHEMYKVFGSAGVIGNPMGFARNMGLGIKDFLSVPARGILKSPSGLITGMAEGTTSLFSNTVYAISNAATQFSKAAHKSIVAFTFDDQAVTKIEEQRKGLTSHSKGLLNEFLEGLTGFLQSPIRGAEKHGLPGVLSGIALGTAGLVARPVASILDVTGRTAQSIRNRSSLHQTHRFRVRFPRPLARDVPLRPYSWEEAIGTSMLMDADDAKFKDELFVMCKALKQPGDFVIITERHVLVVRCSSLVTLGTPEFHGVAADPEWQVEVEMSLESVIHVDREEEVLNIVGGSSSETPLRQHMQTRGTATRTKRWSHYSTPLPLFQISMELANKEEAEDVLQVLLSTIEAGKIRGLEVHVLHQSNLR